MSEGNGFASSRLIQCPQSTPFPSPSTPTTAEKDYWVCCIRSERHTQIIFLSLKQPINECFSRVLGHFFPITESLRLYKILYSFLPSLTFSQIAESLRLYKILYSFLHSLMPAVAAGPSVCPIDHRRDQGPRKNMPHPAQEFLSPRRRESW